MCENLLDFGFRNTFQTLSGAHRSAASRRNVDRSTAARAGSSPAAASRQRATSAGLAATTLARLLGPEPGHDARGVFMT